MHPYDALFGQIMYSFEIGVNIFISLIHIHIDRFLLLMATSDVAGSIALLLEENSQLNLKQIRQKIEQIAKKLSAMGNKTRIDEDGHGCYINKYILAYMLISICQACSNDCRFPKFGLAQGTPARPVSGNSSLASGRFRWNCI
ncbi:MAG: hypothetical protein HQM03_12140 [Magnetococcales bacterium]|nr:hypothetical protein [Magnetococcales bacterium]